MLCLACNHEISDDSKFCEKCGQKVPRCPTCGQAILRRTRFCVNDGTPLPEDILALIPFEAAEPVQPADAEETDDAGAGPAAESDGAGTYAEPQPAPQPAPDPFFDPGKRRFCIRCGAPCDDGQVICARCRSAQPPQTVVSDSEQNGTAPKEKKKRPILILVIVIVLLLALALGAAGYFLINGGLLDLWGSVDEDGVSEHDSDDDRDRDNDRDRDRDGDDDDDGTTDSAAASAEDGGDEQPGEAGEKAPEQEPGDSGDADSAGEAAAIEYLHIYEVVAGDLTWEEAAAACEAKGGYLAVITSAEEYEEISGLATDSGLTYLWLGATLRPDFETWGNGSWISGEDWSFEKWYPGEPSKEDSDGTKEYCLCLWNAKYNGEDIGWTFNDQRSDLVGSFPNLSGRVGYICEYEIEVPQ